LNLFKALAGLFIKSKLDEQKNRLADKLNTQIATTNSDYVKGRNAAYLDLLDAADKAVTNKIAEKL
jgi:hypothetical protein